MKVYNLLVLEEAKLEISKAYLHYEACSEGLGEQFLDVLDEYYVTKLRNPKLYAKKYKDMRQALIKKFPYVIIYEIENDDVVVYAVFNASRDPNIWKNRT